MDFKRVLDIDSLVVRSNITVTIPGTSTFTNLPTDVVRLDPTSGQILEQYISNVFVRLMSGSNIINPNLLPSVDTTRKTLMHTKDRVGIGLLNPQQKLHVHGSQCITSGRLGIGTFAPASTLHVLDNNGPGPMIRFEQQGTVDVLQIVGSNSTPLMYINANNSVGIRTSSPNASYALEVVGAVRASSSIRTNALESDAGTINVRQTTLSNIQGAFIRDLYVSNTASIPGTLTTNTLVTTNTTSDTLSATTQPYMDVYSAMRITGFSPALYQTFTQNLGDTTDQTKIGLKVNYNLLAQAFLSVSDERAKCDIVNACSRRDLETLMNIPVCNFRMKDPEHGQSNMLGFIAQQVEKYAPYAVRTTTNAIPSVLRVASCDGKVITLLAHGLQTGTLVKLLVDGSCEKVARVGRTTEDTFELDEAINNTNNVFVYGEVVSDFKLIDSDRLLPVVFNAVKEMNNTITQQQHAIDDIIRRLDALERR